MTAETASEASQPRPVFSGSISRRLGLAFAAFFLLILGIGGLSSYQAWSILSSSQEILRESHHVEVTERIHATLHHLIREVDRAVMQRTLDRQMHMADLTKQAADTITAFLDEHVREEGAFAEKEAEIGQIRAIHKLYQDLDAAASRIIARLAVNTRAGEDDLSILDAVAHQLPTHIQQLNEIHQAKARRLIAGGITRMKVILGAYLAFLVFGGSCVIVGVVLFSRTVALPLRRLASATLNIAAGEFGKRVPITSQDEIGQLSQSFNDMAGTLQRREEELRGAQVELHHRVMESQALYRIGVEISSMLELDKVLHSVAEKARTLLQSQGAVLCLFPPGRAGLEVRAVSGPVEPSGVEAEKGQPRCLAEPEGCLCPGSEACSICMLLDGRPPAAGLAAPLKRGDDVLGALCVGRKEARPFQAEDRELLEGLAAQAAIAIENARLYAEVRSLATVQERERIAREMHDGLAQALGFLRFRLRTLEDRLEDGGQPPASPELAEMRVVAGKAFEEVRQSIFGLRTMVSRSLGLLPTLTEYLHEFSAQHGIQVDLQVQEDRVPGFSSAEETQLVRIIQEALTNIWKHAKATRAVIRFGVQNGHREVTIQDNGRGFEPERTRKGGSSRFGLETMRERAEGLGGDLEIESRPGAGTTVTIRLPRLPGRNGDGPD
jgi:nitrate/nitrite-specific signal transduction histidine kinase